MKTKPDSKQAQESITFLQGHRIRLRPNDITDLERYVRWVNDEENRNFIGTAFPTTKIQEEEWLREKPKNPDNVQLAIETNDGVHIGDISIFKIRWIDRTAETGTLIGDKRYWDNGYGTEAKMLLLKYAFETLGLRKVHSRAFAYNERSIKYSLKCGYKIIGRQKDGKFRFGKWHDMILLEVFYEEWVVAYNAWTKSLQNKSVTKITSKKPKR